MTAETLNIHSGTDAYGEGQEPLCVIHVGKYCNAILRVGEKDFLDNYRLLHVI